MNSSLALLFDKCSAFNKVHQIICHESKGNSFFCHNVVYGILHSFFKDNDQAKNIMHDYLRDSHPDYDEDTTNRQIKSIIEKGVHKPVTCKTLQLDGYCEGSCASIGSYKSPIVLLFKAQNIPDVFIGQDIRTLLQFFKTYKLSGSEERVIMCLVAYKNPENNVVYPSIKTITNMTGLSEKTVKNALKRLSSKKLITKYLQRQKGEYPFNKYTLSQELLDGYKPKLGVTISKHKLGVTSTPILEPITIKSSMT